MLERCCAVAQSKAIFLWSSVFLAVTRVISSVHMIVIIWTKLFKLKISWSNPMTTEFLSTCCSAHSRWHIPAVYQSQPSSICWFDPLLCLHPEWSCLEKTQNRRNSHYSQSEQTLKSQTRTTNIWWSEEVTRTLSPVEPWWLTCLSVPSFCNETLVTTGHTDPLESSHQNCVCCYRFY